MQGEKRAEQGRVPPGVEWDRKPGGNCPVQGEGRWGAREVYFRSRGDAWSLSVEDGEGAHAAVDAAHGAGAPLGNAGWIDGDEADELARAHLWAWSWQERGLEEDSVQGALCRAMRLLDAEAAERAIGAGADPRAPLEAGGPLPMAMALALSDHGSARRSGPGGGGAGNGPDSMAVWDEAREGRRAECVAALLKAGASPDDAGPGWGLRPAHWAAMLPAGQKSMEAAYCATWGAEEASALSRQGLAENARARSNPWFLLARAGADVWAPAGGGGGDALDMAMRCQAMALAEAMSEHLGGAAMERVANRWIEMAGIDAMLARMGGAEGGASSDPFGGDAFARLMGEFGSGRWPLEWLGGGGRRADAGEAAGEVRARLQSLAEARILGSSVEGAKKGGLTGRL